MGRCNNAIGCVVEWNGEEEVRKIRNHYILGNEKLTEQQFSDKYWKGGEEEFVYQFHTMDIADGMDERQQLLINNDNALFRYILETKKERCEKVGDCEFQNMKNKMKYLIGCLIIILAAWIITSLFRPPDTKV